MFALLPAAQHATSTVNAGMGDVAASSNLLAGVYHNHNHKLAELVSQLACDVTQQSGLACTSHNMLLCGRDVVLPAHHITCCRCRDVVLPVHDL